MNCTFGVVRILFVTIVSLLAPSFDCLAVAANDSAKTEKFPVSKSDAEWKRQLTPEQYHVLREKGTERAFRGKYDQFFQPGLYLCAACGNELFKSGTKYDAHEGWPAFSAPASASCVALHPDNSFLMQRTEVLCARCGGHLGHVFDDGPKPTGQRYCINSAALKFESKRP